jgi:hypothetical protein
MYTHKPIYTQIVMYICIYVCGEREREREYEERYNRKTSVMQRLLECLCCGGILANLAYPFEEDKNIKIKRKQNNNAIKSPNYEKLINSCKN